jgi:hypothetical protein
MKNFRLSLSVFLVVFFLFPATQIFAHGGGHEPEEKKTEVSTPPVADSMYAIKKSETDSGDSLDNMFSPTDLFTQDELVSPDPMPDMKMEGSHGASADHQEPMVELSQHERVSSSSKGFGTAVGITLFAGIVFAGLTYMRPGE